MAESNGLEDIVIVTSDILNASSQTDDGERAGFWEFGVVQEGWPQLILHEQEKQEGVPPVEQRNEYAIDRLLPYIAIDENKTIEGAWEMLPEFHSDATTTNGYVLLYRESEAQQQLFPRVFVKDGEEVRELEVRISSQDLIPTVNNPENNLLDFHDFPTAQQYFNEQGWNVPESVASFGEETAIVSEGADSADEELFTAPSDEQIPSETHEEVFSNLPSDDEEAFTLLDDVRTASAYHAAFSAITDNKQTLLEIANELMNDQAAREHLQEFSFSVGDLIENDPKEFVARELFDMYRHFVQRSDRSDDEKDAFALGMKEVRETLNANFSTYADLRLLAYSTDPEFKQHLDELNDLGAERAGEELCQFEMEYLRSFGSINSQYLTEEENRQINSMINFTTTASSTTSSTGRNGLGWKTAGVASLISLLVGAGVGWSTKHFMTDDKPGIVKTTPETKGQSLESFLAFFHVGSKDELTTKLEMLAEYRALGTVQQFKEALSRWETHAGRSDYDAIKRELESYRALGKTPAQLKGLEDALRKKGEEYTALEKEAAGLRNLDAQVRKLVEEAAQRRKDLQTARQSLKDKDTELQEALRKLREYAKHGDADGVAKALEELKNYRRHGTPEDIARQLRSGRSADKWDFAATIGYMKTHMEEYRVSRHHLGKESRVHVAYILTAAVRESSATKEFVFDCFETMMKGDYRNQMYGQRPEERAVTFARLTAIAAEYGGVNKSNMDKVRSKYEELVQSRELKKLRPEKRRASAIAQTRGVLGSE